MNFTVVRAVRGSDLSPPRPDEALRRVSLLPPPAPRLPAAMDLPYAEEVLHLEIGDFPMMRRMLLGIAERAERPA